MMFSIQLPQYTLQRHNRWSWFAF